MRKDIKIPKVKDVYIAIVYEFNTTHKTYDWVAYIINDKDVDIDTIIIVTTGFSKEKITSTFRKKIDKLAAKSFAKIELMQEDLFALNNSFKVTFFEGNTLYNKDFLFKENTINKNVLKEIPLLNEKGILVK